MEKCKCGEKLVCPKCTSIVEKTNTIIVRAKDTEYNGGMPNQIIIAPCWSDDEHNRSTAVIVGDNFWKYPHFTVRTFSVLQMAKWIAESDYSYMSGVFDLKNQKRPFLDLQNALKEYLEQMAEAEVS